MVFNTEKVTLSSIMIDINRPGCGTVLTFTQQ